MRRTPTSRTRTAWQRAAVLALALGFLGAGCANPTRPSQLFVVFDRAPSTLDPHHHNEIVGWSLLCNFYEALVAFSPEMKIQPALAQAWTQTDATHLTFSLVKGARFHSGAPFTARDVVASFERALHDPRSRIRHHLVGIRSVRAHGENEVVVETTAPAATLLNRLAFLFIVPADLTNLPEITEPDGTGPYRFVGRGSDGSVIAEAARDRRGMPSIQRVAFSFVEDEDTRTARFLAGGVDVTPRVADESLKEIQRRPGLGYRALPNLGVQVLIATPSAASGDAGRALADVRVRRAILLAINRSGLVNRAYRGNGSVASQYAHPAVNGFDGRVQAAPYDPLRARSLLRDAGFARGFEVTLGHGFIPPSYVAAIVDDLAAVGITVRPQQYPLGELLQRARTGKLPLTTYQRTCTTGDLSEFLDAMIHTPDSERGAGVENYARYSDPATDALLDEANRELDARKRLALLQRAQQRALDALPILPLTIRWDFVGVSERVEPEIRNDGWLNIAGFRWSK